MSELLRKLEERAKKKPIKRPLPNPKRPLAQIVEIVMTRPRPLIMGMLELMGRKQAYSFNKVKLDKPKKPTPTYIT